jgi:hypothetical protein
MEYSRPPEAIGQFDIQGIPRNLWKVHCNVGMSLPTFASLSEMKSDYSLQS